MCPGRDRNDLPPVNFIQNCVRLCLSMLVLKILTYPINEVIFKYTLDELVQEVRSYQLVYIRTRKIICKWLDGQVREAAMY